MNRVKAKVLGLVNCLNYGHPKRFTWRYGTFLK